MVLLLINIFRVNVNCRENERHTPFMALCANGYLDIIKFFVENDFYVNF